MYIGFVLETFFGKVNEASKINETKNGILNNFFQDFLS